MKYTAGSLVAIVSIPLIALALEPANPSGFCSRFLDEPSVKNCEEKTDKDNVDWYAAAVCNLQQEDSAFWKCWDSVKGKAFNPQALEKCGETADFSDDQRQSCVDSAGGSGRRPASENSLFQPLKLEKKSKK